MSQSLSQFPAEPAQRISQHFWNSEPAYSEPPPSLMLAEPPVVVRSPQRGLFAKLLFVSLFLPMVALLVLVLKNHF